MTELETFTAAYIKAMYFSDTGDEGQPPSDAELSEEAQLDIEADCRSFWRRFGCYVTTEICTNAFDDSVSQAGHDFFFTRNGHGCGFWEDEWPETYRDMLAAAARGYGELNLHLGKQRIIEFGLYKIKSKPETIKKYDEKKRRRYFERYARLVHGVYAIYFVGIITAKDTHELYQKFEKAINEWQPK